MQVAEAPRHRAVAPLDLDQVRRRVAVGHHEVDLAARGVAEVAQFQVSAAHVLLVVHPFQQVHGHQVLEAGAGAADRNPVVVVVLPRLLHGADRRRAERRHADDGVQPLQHVEPAGDGAVADLQVLAQRVDGERRAHQIGQPDGQPLDGAQVADPLQVAQVLGDQPHAVGARPAAGGVRRVAQPGFGEAAPVEQPRQPLRVGDAELGHRQRMQAQQVVAALQGVAAVAVVVEPAAAGHQDARAAAAVVDALEEPAPAVELVQLVEDQQRRVREPAAQDRVAVVGDVPVQVARRVRQQAARQRGLAHLPRAGDEDHLPRQIGPDAVGQITPQRGRHRTDADDFTPTGKNARRFSIRGENGRRPLRPAPVRRPARRRLRSRKGTLGGARSR